MKDSTTMKGNLYTLIACAALSLVASSVLAGGLISGYDLFAFVERTAPATPAAGIGHLYAAEDGTLHYLNDSASDIELGAGGFTSSWDASGIVSPAANFGTLDTRGIHHLFDLDDTSDESGYVRGVAPDSYDTSSDITLEIHWTAETATSNDALIFYAWERDAANDLDLDSTSFTAATNVTSTANGVSGKIIVASFTVNNAAADGLQAGDGFVIQVGRDADSSGTGTDNMSDDAEIFKVVVVWP